MMASSSLYPLITIHPQTVLAHSTQHRSAAQISTKQKWEGEGHIFQG